MEGKLRATWRVSLALTLVLSLGFLTAPSAGAANGLPPPYDSAGQFEFTVPAGVYSITVEAWGAGGAGGGSTNGGPFSARGGGGGGGGAYASSTLSVTPGDVLRVVVGAGGVGVSGGNGEAGGPSFVGPSTNPADAYVRAAGGSGGTANTAGGSPPGGAGGTILNSVGQPPTPIAGDDGEPGGTCFTSCSGAGGRGAYGGGYGGAKLCGPYVTAAGNPGDPPGGGGGGGRTSQYNGARAGGAGGVGKVVITYSAEEEVCASIWPITNVYDLANPGDVTTLITWHDSPHAIASIYDGMAYLTPVTHYTVGDHDGTATLTIRNTYLAGKLTTAGQSVELTIAFDTDCEATFTVTAVETSVECATISPTARQYDLASPANATTTITWNDATGIVSIHDGTGYLTSGTHYTLVGSTLTILHTTYLAGKLTAAGQSVTLTINFDICSPVTFTITAIDTSQPVCVSISPTTRQYNLASPGDVSTAITWNDITSIVSIHDGTGYLTPGTHYTVVGNTLTIKYAYLAGKLTATGQSVVLTINCDPICATPFVIMALGTSAVCASISPTTRQYDLSNPANATTTITWNDATSIVSIADNGGTLTLNTHYTVVGNTLTILSTYLAGKLTAAGQSVTLTINFGICAATFTITAIDTSVICATLSPTTRQYDLASPANATTTITWNDATSIVSIGDNGGTLTLNTHYTVVGNTLTILSTYLAGKLTAAGQSVTLTINFGICAATFTITAIDTSASVCASISPTEREYNLADPCDVTTLITWHDSPHNIASIYDGIAYLAPGTQYTVQPYNGTARLTIRSTYLEGKLTTAGASVVLTIKFADDCEATLTITAVDEPIVVGLTGYPVNKLTVMTPWLVLFAALAAGTSLLALRRRRA